MRFHQHAHTKEANDQAETIPVPVGIKIDQPDSVISFYCTIGSPLGDRPFKIEHAVINFKTYIRYYNKIYSSRIIAITIVC